MTTWTVLSYISHSGSTRSGIFVAAIRGRVNAYGMDLHAATVTADTADDALAAARDAFRIVGTAAPNAHEFPPEASRWTVIGTADSGVCASHNTIGVVAGEHTVEGVYQTELQHRWVQVVDAPDATAAELAGYKAAAEQYNETWN